MCHKPGPKAESSTISYLLTLTALYECRRFGFAFQHWDEKFITLLLDKLYVEHVKLLLDIGVEHSHFFVSEGKFVLLLIVEKN